MQPKSFGVAKWSTLRKVTSWAWGSASTSGSPGPAKSLSPSTTRIGRSTVGQALGGEDGTRRAQAGRQRLPVDAGLLGQAGEVLHHGVGGIALTLDRLEDEVAALGAEQVGAHAREHQTAEPLGLVARQREQHPGAEAEADAVDRAVRQLRGHQRLHLGVGGRIVRLVGAVPWPSRSMGMAARPPSPSRSSQPLSPQVRALEVAKPWTRTTGSGTSIDATCASDPGRPAPQRRRGAGGRPPTPPGGPGRAPLATRAPARSRAAGPWPPRSRR